MKNNIFLPAAFFLLIVSYLLVLQIQPNETKSMTRCIPGYALMYFEQHNIFDLLSKLSTSALGGKIQAIDFAAVAKEIGAGAETIAAINNFAFSVKYSQENALARELFGLTFALALLPPSNDSPAFQNSGDFLKENLVIIARPADPVKVFEMLSATFQGSSSDTFLPSSQYGRHRIQRIAMNKRTLSLVLLNGDIVIAENEKQLRRCIDTSDNEVPSFSDNPDFLTLMSRFSQPTRLMVLDLGNVRKYLPFLFTQKHPGDKFSVTGSFLSINGVMGFSYAATNQISTSKEKIIVRYQPEHVDPVLWEQLAIPPIMPPRLRLSTPDPMLYFWSNSLNLQPILTYFSAIDLVKVPPAETDSHAEVIKAKDHKQILDMLGKEITVVVEPGPDIGPLSVPLTTIFVSVGEMDALKSTLKELLDAYGIPTKTEKIGLIEYVYWSQSPQDGMTPLYGFFGDQFFLGNSPSLLHKINDSHSRGISLLDNNSVKRIDPGLTDENNSVLYCNNRQLIDTLKTLLITLGALVAIEDRELAMKAKVVINKVLLPLLDGMKIYDASVIRSYFTKEMVFFDIITNISHHP